MLFEYFLKTILVFDYYYLIYKDHIYNKEILIIWEKFILIKFDYYHFRKVFLAKCYHFQIICNFNKFIKIISMQNNKNIFRLYS